MPVFEVLVFVVHVASTAVDSFICGSVCPATQPGTAFSILHVSFRSVELNFKL